jgi:hypothetical protein
MSAGGSIRGRTRQETQTMVIPRIWLLPLLFLTAGAGTAIADPPVAAPRDATAATNGPPVLARVVIVEDTAATLAFSPQMPEVRRMMEHGLLALTGKSNIVAAWRTLVSTNDTVGIKVYSTPGEIIGTRPAVTAALVESLLSAGLPPKHIIVWDREIASLRLAGFFDLADRYGIRVAGALEAGYATNFYYDSPFLGQLVYGDLEFGEKGPGVGRKSYVSKLVSQEMTKIINLTPLLNHNLTGVCGNLYSLALGSVDNSLRFAGDASQLSVAIPDIYALEMLGDRLGDRVVLNITDALIAQYAGEDRSHLHYATSLNQLRFSTDPVALDVLSVQELARQRELNHVPPVKTDMSLYQNASSVWIGVSDPTKIHVEYVP